MDSIRGPELESDPKPVKLPRKNRSQFGEFQLIWTAVQPDIDIRNLNLSLDIALSSAWEARLPLRWIALLHGRVTAALAASTGIDSPDDVYKLILAGADTVMTTPALLRHGVPHMRQLVNGLADLLAARNLDSPSQARGQMSAQRLSLRCSAKRARVCLAR